MINVIKEDIVLIYLDHTLDKIKIKGSVISVKERLGKINNGTTKQNPLIEYKVLDSTSEKLQHKVGNVGFCDVGFITEILMRVKNSKIFKPRYIPDPDGFNVSWIEKRGKTITGPLDSLIISAWRFIYGNDEYLDVDKAVRLYLKQQKPGCVSTLFGGILEIRYNKLINWIKRSHNHLLIKK